MIQQSKVQLKERQHQLEEMETSAPHFATTQQQQEITSILETSQSNTLCDELIQLEPTSQGVNNDQTEGTSINQTLQPLSADQVRLLPNISPTGTHETSHHQEQESISILSNDQAMKSQGTDNNQYKNPHQMVTRKKVIQ